MKLIIGLIIQSLLAVLFGYLTKAVNESKGYNGGFGLGFWTTFLFPGLGILITSCKKEQPNAKPNAFRAVPMQNVFKKYHYPFVSPSVEPIDILKGNIHAEAEATGMNITFLLIHDLFMLFWYMIILGIYIWYLFGYTVYWLFKYRPLKKINNALTDDMAEKLDLARGKVGTAVADIKNKASAFADEHKRSADKSSADIDDTTVPTEKHIPESSTIGAAKTAGNVAAKLTKNAADYLKSDDAAEKMNFLKGKAKSAASGAGSMLSGIRSKASGMISEQRNKSNDEYTDADNIENIANAENIYDDVSAESTYSDQQDSSVSDTNYDENTVHHEEDVSEYENSQITENQITSSVVSSRQESPPIEIKNSPNIPQSTPNPVSSGTPGYVIQKQKSNIALIIVIIVLVLIIGILGGMFFMMSRDKKSDEPSKNSSVSVVKETTDNENSSKETEIITAVTTENISEKTTEKPIQTESSVNISCSKNDVNQTYADIVKSMDFPPPNRGFILDLNNNGVNEMIIPNTDNMNFVMYYFDGNSIQSCSFGNFIALDNFVIYQVDGEDKNNYIYYHDNYAYKSLQGYYSFPSDDKLDIFINYPENNGKYSADWTIDYNKTENYAKGNESVDTFYGQPSDCHNKLLSAFKNYGFKITENSKYTEVKGLYYDELINKLSGGDNNIEKEENSTTKSDAPKATASISIEPQQIIGNGTELLATVSGNYSYFTYECYWDGEGKTNQLLTSGTSYNKSVTISGGSTIKKITFVVTPYNADDLPGDTITSNYTGPWSYVFVNKYGQINAPGGGPINGYATSYILNGGEVAYTRTDLMDKWHVTAVNLCTFNGIIWYELYDTDDGDYYGWVDENHIVFY